jgi:hypothetical protein
MLAQNYNSKCDQLITCVSRLLSFAKQNYIMTQRVANDDLRLS